MRTPTAIQTNKLLPSDARPSPPSQEQIDAMSESIRSYGIMEPLAVRRIGDRYQIIPGGGEVRLRAAQLLGMEIVPIRVISVDDHASAALSLIASLERESIAPEEVISSLERLVAEYGVNAAETVTEQLAELGENAAESPELQDGIKALLASCGISNHP